MIYFRIIKYQDLSLSKTSMKCANSKLKLKLFWIFSALLKQNNLSMCIMKLFIVNLKYLNMWNTISMKGNT